MRYPHRLRALLLLALAVTLLTGCGSPESRKQKYLDKGKAYVAQENWEKARIEFRNALQIVPNDAEARYESGLVAEKLGRPRDAVAMYRGALDVRPDYPEASFRLARSFLLGGAAAQANDVLKPALDKHPDDPALLTIRAGVRGQLKDMAGALEDAERAYQAAPAAEDTIAVLAGLYKSAGRQDDSIRVLEAGIGRLPKSVDLRLALTQAYLEAGRKDEAEKTLVALVGMQPDHPEHTLRLARFYAQTGRAPQAEQTLRDGIKANPSNVALKYAIVQMTAELKGRDAAEAELKAQVAENPKLPELKLALAQFYEAIGAPDKATTVYKGVIDGEGTRQAGISARDALAALKFRSGDVAGAEALVGDVLRSNPRDTQALSVRSDIALRKNDPKSAIADLRSVLRDQPNSVPALRALARAHVANGEPAQAEEVLRRGVDALPNDTGLALTLTDYLVRANKLEQARTVIDGVAKRAPADPYVQEQLLKVQLRQDDFAGAHATAATAKKTLRVAAVGDYFEGLASEAEGKNDAALDAYGRALDALPQAEDVLNAYARLAVREKKNEPLRQRLAKITAADPKAAHAWQLLGELDLGEHRLPEARDAFGKAVAAAPRRLEGYRGLALVESTGGNIDGAAAILKDASTKVGNADDALFEVAALYQQSKRTDDARKAYETLLEKNPGYEAGANNLAMLLTQSTDKASLDRARALAAPLAKSTNPRFVDTYGWVLTVRGEYPEAIATLSKLTEQYPTAAPFRYHLALAQIKGGQVAAGRATLEDALKSGDQFEGGADARALLDSLRKG